MRSAFVTQGHEENKEHVTSEEKRSEKWVKIKNFKWYTTEVTHRESCYSNFKKRVL
jgi:hypothetical protein